MTPWRSAAALLLALGAAGLFAGCASVDGSRSATGGTRAAAAAPVASAASTAAVSAVSAAAPIQAPVATDTAPSATPAVASPVAESAASAAAATSTGGVQISVEAPAELKALLERHLDVVRLGRLARDDVDDSEWSRLIEAVPAQVRSLLQTEGYFAPTVQLEREPRRAAGEADIVRLKVQPGTRARVSRVTLEAQGELERGASAGTDGGPNASTNAVDSHAGATLAQLRRRLGAARRRGVPERQLVRCQNGGADAAALGRLRHRRLERHRCRS